MSLPTHLRFHEFTLSTAANLVNSPLPFVVRTGWFFAFMHCIAESGMYSLQSALVASGERWPADRQDQAVDNIVVIMDALGRKGRSAPLCDFAFKSYR